MNASSTKEIHKNGSIKKPNLVTKHVKEFKEKVKNEDVKEKENNNDNNQSIFIYVKYCINFCVTLCLSKIVNHKTSIFEIWFTCAMVILHVYISSRQIIKIGKRQEFYFL